MEKSYRIKQPLAGETEPPAQEETGRIIRDEPAWKQALSLSRADVIVSENSYFPNEVSYSRPSSFQ